MDDIQVMRRHSQGQENDVAEASDTRYSRRRSTELDLIEDYESYDTEDITGWSRRGRGIIQAHCDSRLLCCKCCRANKTPRPILIPELRGEVYESLPQIFCRICRDAKEDEIVIKPCLCKGSIGHVHASCLKQWLQVSQTSRCELCYYPYSIRERRAGSVCASIPIFLQIPTLRKELCGDVFALVIIIPLTLYSVNLLIRGAFTSDVPPGSLHSLEYQSTTATRVGSLILAVILGVAFCIWLYYSLSAYFKKWREWYENWIDVEVLLVNVDPEEDSSMSLDGRSSAELIETSELGTAESARNLTRQ